MLMELVPDALLTRIAQGDPSAVRACLVRYGGLVWSLARRFFLEGEAEDAVQEIFIELWRNAGKFDPSKGTEATFIATIARRRLIDRRRRLSRRPATEALNLEAEGQAAAPEQRLETQEEAKIAAEAFEKLRPEQQQVLRHSIYDGWSHQKIADQLELPLGRLRRMLAAGSRAYGKSLPSNRIP